MMLVLVLVLGAGAGAGARVRLPVMLLTAVALVVSHWSRERRVDARECALHRDTHT
jgi:hypothetical protein